MQIQFNRNFFKDLAAIDSKQRTQIESFVSQIASKPNVIEQLGKLEKLKGYRDFYRIRIGNYRIGIKFENDVYFFERVLHRKEIYKKFP